MCYELLCQYDVDLGSYICINDYIHTGPLPPSQRQISIITYNSSLYKKSPPPSYWREAIPKTDLSIYFEK